MLLAGMAAHVLRNEKFSLKVFIIYFLAVLAVVSTARTPRLAPAASAGSCDRFKRESIKSTFRDHFFIFVGGAHQTGTSVIEKILSSQLLTAGLGAEGIDVADTSSCRRKEKRQNCQCFAPENEGIFLTTVLDEIHRQRGSDCSYGHNHKMWGTACAIKSQLTDDDANDLMFQANGAFFSLSNHSASDSSLQPSYAIPDKLFSDWSKFWTNMNAPYLIEKDIANMVQSTFLQTLFGASRSSFVFVLKVFIYCVAV